MSKATRTLSIIIGMAVIFTLCGNAFISVAKDTSDKKVSEARNGKHLQHLIHKNKGKKGTDYAAESTAGVGAGADKDLKADETTKQELKDVKASETYKDAAEMAKPDIR